MFFSLRNLACHVGMFIKHVRVIFSHTVGINSKVYKFVYSFENNSFIHLSTIGKNIKFLLYYLRKITGMVKLLSFQRDYCGQKQSTIYGHIK